MEREEDQVIVQRRWSRRMKVESEGTGG